MLNFDEDVGKFKAYIQSEEISGEINDTTKIIIDNHRRDKHLIQRIQGIAKVLEDHACSITNDFETRVMLNGFIYGWLLDAYRERGLTPDQITVVYRAFADEEFEKYKNKINHKSLKSIGNIRKAQAQYEVDKYVVDESISNLRKIKPELYTTEQIQDISKKLKAVHNLVDNRCNEKGIPINMDSFADLYKSEKIKMPDTIPEEDILSKAMMILSTKWRKMAEKVIQQGVVGKDGKPRMNPESRHKLAACLAVQAWMLDFLIDDKHLYSPIQWAQVHGIDAEWFTNYAKKEASIEALQTGIKKITREQIKATREEYSQMYRFAVENLPYLKLLFIDWFNEVAQPDRIQHAIELSPKLSDAS